MRTILIFEPRPNDRNMPTQHCWAQHMRTFGHRVATCWVLLAQIWQFSKLGQQHPTCRNTVAKRTQHVAPNNVATCCVGMLRSFGRGFNTQHFAKRCNRVAKRTQHVASNSVAICCAEMLPSFGRNLQMVPTTLGYVLAICCDRTLDRGWIRLEQIDTN